MVKGAAWSVPVIAAAVAAPMSAASGDNIIGVWRESSLNITQTSINMSSPFIHCARNSDGTPVYDPQLWSSQPFEKTVTITYTGDNENFTFIGSTTSGHYAISEVSQYSITMTHTDPNGTACSSGFTGLNLYFNSTSAGGTIPIEEIEDYSLVITASARAGDYFVNEIIDVTPCSPVYGETPRGPRDVPSRVEGEPCSNGQPHDPYA